MPQSLENNSSAFHSKDTDEFEQLIHQSSYFELYKVRVGLQWMIRKQVRKEFQADPILNDILLKEFQIGLSCNNKHIPAYYFLKEHTTGKQLYLEFMEGESLDHILNTTETLHPDSWDYDFLQQLLETLLYLESKDIQYGDLHPGNILYQKKYKQFVLIDFGFANQKNFSKIEGGRLNYNQSGLTASQQLLFALNNSALALQNSKAPLKSPLIEKFNEYCLRNDYNLTIEQALAFVEENKPTKKSQYPILLTTIIVALLLGFGLIRFQFARHYTAINQPTNNRQSSIPKIVLQTNTNSPVKEHKIGETNRFQTIDSLRFIKDFKIESKGLSKSQAFSLRTTLILKYDQKFKRALLQIKDAAQKKEFSQAYNRSYYADFISSQKLIDSLP